MITRDNYEAYFLDYLEGNLQENMIDEFLDFLEQHPDLKEELMQFENIRLPEEQLVFEAKEQLYRSAGNDKPVFDRQAVSFMEGDLDEQERASFEAWLAKEPVLKKEYELFAKTRLEADARIVFPRKKALYRKTGTTIFLNWAARAAAVLVLVWGISSLLQTGKQPTGTGNIQEIVTLKPTTPTSGNTSVPVTSGVEKMLTEKPSGSINNQLASAEVKPSGKNEQIPGTQESMPHREPIEMEPIQPILAMIETNADENRLAVSYKLNTEKLNDPLNIMTVDEFLASRAKKVANEGLFSAQRILRTGLDVASEISGDRLGYSVKDGKITTLEFESRLMAFSIPLQKK